MCPASHVSLHSFNGLPIASHTSNLCKYAETSEYANGAWLARRQPGQLFALPRLPPLVCVVRKVIRIPRKRGEEYSNSGIISRVELGEDQPAVSLVVLADPEQEHRHLGPVGKVTERAVREVVILRTVLIGVEGEGFEVVGFAV